MKKEISYILVSFLLINVMPNQIQAQNPDSVLKLMSCNNITYYLLEKPFTFKSGPDKAEIDSEGMISFIKLFPKESDSVFYDLSPNNSFRYLSARDYADSVQNKYLQGIWVTLTDFALNKYIHSSEIDTIILIYTKRSRILGLPNGKKEDYSHQIKVILTYNRDSNINKEEKFTLVSFGKAESPDIELSVPVKIECDKPVEYFQDVYKKSLDLWNKRRQVPLTIAKNDLDQNGINAINRPKTSAEDRDSLKTNTPKKPVLQDSVYLINPAAESRKTIQNVINQLALETCLKLFDYGHFSPDRSAVEADQNYVNKFGDLFSNGSVYNDIDPPYPKYLNADAYKGKADGFFEYFVIIADSSQWKTSIEGMGPGNTRIWIPFLKVYDTYQGPDKLYTKAMLGKVTMDVRSKANEAYILDVKLDSIVMNFRFVSEPLRFNLDTLHQESEVFMMVDSKHELKRLIFTGPVMVPVSFHINLCLGKSSIPIEPMAELNQGADFESSLRIGVYELSFTALYPLRVKNKQHLTAHIGLEIMQYSFAGKNAAYYRDTTNTSIEDLKLYDNGVPVYVISQSTTIADIREHGTITSVNLGLGWAKEQPLKTDKLVLFFNPRLGYNIPVVHNYSLVEHTSRSGMALIYDDWHPEPTPGQLVNSPNLGFGNNMAGTYHQLTMAKGKFNSNLYFGLTTSLLWKLPSGSQLGVGASFEFGLTSYFRADPNPLFLLRKSYTADNQTILVQHSTNSPIHQFNIVLTYKMSHLKPMPYVLPF